MPRSNNKKEARHSKPEEKTTKIKTPKGKIPKNKKRKQHPKLKLFLSNNIPKNTTNNIFTIMCSRSRDSLSNDVWTIWQRL